MYMQENTTPVYKAAEKGYVGALRALISAGANFNTANVVSIECVKCYMLFVLYCVLHLE